ncbi:hypothetical protein FRC19_005814 [Serendipita sp. 401]|nr:hypothetical protein FRC19_005814 [Serendipita sp. 401]
MGPEVAERIAKTKGVSVALENGLLDEHEMLRRANVELLCNLVVCEPVFDRFVPRPGDGGGGGGGGGAAESRLQILVALADVDDLQTRKAASGALAVLSSDERVCSGFVALQKKRGSLLRIFRRLLVDEEEEEDDEPEPEEGASGATSKVKKEEKGRRRRRSKRGESPIADFDLVHRGVFLFRNLAVLFVEKQKSGVKEFMASLAEEEIVSVVERVVKEGMRRQKEGGPDVVAAMRPVLENALEFVIALRNASQVLE